MIYLVRVALAGSAGSHDREVEASSPEEAAREAASAWALEVCFGERHTMLGKDDEVLGWFWRAARAGGPDESEGGAMVAVRMKA